MAKKYKFTYFPILGIAEPIRFLFAYGRIEYEEYRLCLEYCPELKDVSVLEIDMKAVHQSLDASRYLGKQLKLTGENVRKDLQGDTAVKIATDLRLEVAELIYEKDHSKKKEMRKEIIDITMPFYLKKLDEEAEDNSGYFVEGKLTWVDFYVISILNYLQSYLKTIFWDNDVYPNLRIVKENVLNIPPIKSWIENRQNDEHLTCALWCFTK